MSAKTVFYGKHVFLKYIPMVLTKYGIIRFRTDRSMPAAGKKQQDIFPFITFRILKIIWPAMSHCFILPRWNTA